MMNIPLGNPWMRGNTSIQISERVTSVEFGTPTFKAEVYLVRRLTIKPIFFKKLTGFNREVLKLLQQSLPITPTQHATEVSINVNYVDFKTPMSMDCDPKTKYRTQRLFVSQYERELYRQINFLCGVTGMGKLGNSTVFYKQNAIIIDNTIFNFEIEDIRGISQKIVTSVSLDGENVKSKYYDRGMLRHSAYRDILDRENLILCAG